MTHRCVRGVRLYLVAALSAAGLLGCDGNPLVQRWGQLGCTRNLGQDENRVLTVSKYLRIEPGMTYEQAVAVLNVPPECRPPDIDQVTRNAEVTLHWFTPNGARLILYLRGKVVTRKWATGLRE
jgi:hypothetical protein